MGFKEQMQKLLKPYDDEEEDFFEGANRAAKPQPAPRAADMSIEFEQSFSAGDAAAPEPEETRPEKKAAPEGGIFGGMKKAAKPKLHRERTVDFGGQETQVILFNPKTFDEATELVNYLQARRSLVLTLENSQDDARRLLDFISGIAIALQSKITPISGKTYFITPQNVDVLGAQGDLSESDGQYL